MSANVEQDRNMTQHDEILWDDCGFTSRQEMFDWMNSRYFKPYFKEYWRSYLKKEMMKHSKSKSRPRGTNARQIQLRILDGERAGKAKFSTKSPQKKHWDATDHLALFNHDVLRENEINPGGIFHGKVIGDIDKERITWNLTRYRTQVAAPSRIKRSSFRRNDSEDEDEAVPDVDMPDAPAFKKLLITAPSTDSGKASPANLDAVSFTDTGKASSGETPSATSLAGATRMNPGKASSANLETVSADTGNASSDEIPLSEPPTIIIGDEEFTFYDVTRETTSDPKGIQSEVVRVGDIQVTFDNNPEDTAPGGKYLDCEEPPMTNAERMCQENTSPTPDIDQRFWKCWLIDAVMKAKGDVNVLHQMVEVVSDTEKMAKLDSQVWASTVSQSSIEEDSIVYAAFDEKAEKDFDAIERYLDNPKYQPQNHVESCAAIGIDWQGETTKYRIPGMSYSQELYFWQPVAINWLREMAASQILRGCILGDYMGLGKTIEVIAYLLTVRSKRLPLYFPPPPLDSGVGEGFPYTLPPLTVVLGKASLIPSTPLTVVLGKASLNKAIEGSLTQAHRKCLSSKSFR